MLSSAVAACGVKAESFAVTLNEPVPAVVGVPLMVPEVDNDMPAGSEPEANDHVYGEVPPAARRVAE